MSKLHSRIAPTPSGLLHVGNAYNFILTWLHVRKSGGTLRLRIDDLDSPRVSQEYMDDIFITLDWLGIDWDLGPQSVGEHQKEYSQLHRLEEYEKVIKRLWDNGAAFACRCSRNQIKEISSSGDYPGTCRSMGLAYDCEDTAVRIRTAEKDICINEWNKSRTCYNIHDMMPDFVIRRKDGLPAYQIASLTDDVAHEINFIVRGNDLLSSSVAQLFLAENLEIKSFQPVQFRHHGLITDANGRKLSKSAGGRKGKSVREQFGSASELYKFISEQWDLKHPANSAKELLSQVSNDLTETETKK